jgi:hypothetical protein
VLCVLIAAGVGVWYTVTGPMIPNTTRVDDGGKQVKDADHV